MALADRALAGAAGGVGASTARGARGAGARAAPRRRRCSTQLGFAYQLRWRETADPSYLPRSEARAAPRRAVRRGGRGRRPRPRLARAHPARVPGGAATTGARHEGFCRARRGRTASIGDALVELGRYDEAFAAFERMVSLRPSLASYARVAYARELMGDREGAVAAMRLALDAAAGQPEPTAWANVELAKLELGLGHTDAARRTCTRGAPRPSRLSQRADRARADRRGCGRARRRDRARRGAQPRRSRRRLPSRSSPSCSSATGRRPRRGASARPSRSSTAFSRRTASRSTSSRRSHGPTTSFGPDETVELARRARAARPSIYGDDALAWALARAGRCAEAIPLARRALRLGTEDGLLCFHLGYAAGLRRRRGGNARDATAGRSRSTRSSRFAGRPSRVPPCATGSHVSVGSAGYARRA